MDAFKMLNKEINSIIGDQNRTLHKKMDFELK